VRGVRAETVRRSGSLPERQGVDGDRRIDLRESRVAPLDLISCGTFLKKSSGKIQKCETVVEV